MQNIIIMKIKLRFQKGENRPDWCGDRLLCLNVVNSGARYTCNVTGDTWCSFATDNKILTPNGQFITNLTQSYYPYWFWTYNK
jgi:hypothetical protein